MEKLKSQHIEHFKFFLPIKNDVADIKLIENFKDALFKYWSGKSPLHDLDVLWQKLGKDLEHHLMTEKPFETESCGQCSNSAWGEYVKGELTLDTEYGEVPCCINGDDFWEMEVRPEGESLTAEDALEYKICSRYDGPKPYTIKEVKKFLQTRDLMLNTLGFKPGEFFVENLKRSKLIDLEKIDVNNEAHMKIIHGVQEIPLELYNPNKLHEGILKAGPDSKGTLYDIASKLWGHYKDNDKVRKILAPSMASRLTSLSSWTMEQYGLAQDVLFEYLMKEEELSAFHIAVQKSLEHTDEHTWYEDLHKFVKDENRVPIVKDLMRYIQGISCAISEE